MRYSYLLVFGVLISAISPLLSQSLEVSGIVSDQLSGNGIPDAYIRSGDMMITVGEDGRFSFTLNPTVDTSISINAPGFNEQTLSVPKDAVEFWNLGEIKLLPSAEKRTRFIDQDIPVVELTEADFDENASGNVSALLQASRDPYVRAAAFQFSAARFRIRGLESRYTTVLVNGIGVNDPRNGDVFWSQWAGLNDVMRSQENLIGTVFVSDAMSNLGGITTFDTRAHRQRKQTRVSYSVSNRTFTNRIMATHSTGWMKGGWAVSVSGSRRWAEEGYIKGTFFDGYSYFGSVDKRFGDKHTLNLTVIGSPLKRGRSIANTKEQNEIAGTNYYNPYWGNQAGKVRNSRFSDAHQPLAILRYDLKLNRSSKLMASFSYQDGRYGSSALDWNDAGDPRAEYYRRWPSAIEDPVVAQQVYDALASDESLRQVNWSNLYETNRNSTETIEDANGIPGNTVTGLRSKYILQEFRSDPRIRSGRLVYETTIKARHNFSAGVQGQQLTTHYFKIALDLLGGDFWLDLDRFAEFDFPNDPTVLQNDLEVPNRLIGVGDKFGYEYKIHSQNYQGWAQMALTGARIDGFAGVELGYADFYREGIVANGRFPNNSKGDSDLAEFLTWKAKGGVTLKIDGRNYLSLAGFASANAPDFQNGFISPRSRNDLVPDLTTEKVQHGEVSYRLQSPVFKFRVSGYLTDIKDRVEVISFYNDLANTFGNYILSGVNRRHIGTEWGMEWKITPALELNGAASIAQFYYSDRALATVIQENTGEEIYKDRTVYIKNFRVDGIPQEAYSLGLTYNSRKFWFANVQLNYFRKSYLDFSPDRRTAAAVDGIEQGSETWNKILDQEELPGGFMLNIFGGKSWKINNTFLYLNVGINNVLNNTEFITGGFEQLRFDTESRNTDRFPNRYFYAFGTNYFVNLSIRI
jgi:hypothetical protein